MSQSDQKSRIDLDRPDWLRRLDEALGIDPDDPAVIAARNAPMPCGGCGANLRDVRFTERLCINRCCVEWLCPFCGAGTGSGWGPVGCRCRWGRTPGPNPLSIDGHALRRRYKSRKRRK